MSSDSEFERFLQESLTESGTSESASVSSDAISHDLPAYHLAASQGVLIDDKYWWDTQSDSDEDNINQQDDFKDGSTWLKSNTKLGSSSTALRNEKQVNGHGEQPMQSLAGDARQQPITVPLAPSASDSSSRSSENFTHDSLDATSQFPPAEVTQSKATSQNEEVSLSPQTTPCVQERISENVEEGTMPESSSKKLEQDYEESSFESDTDDPDETLQPGRSKSVSRSSSHSSSSSVSKKSSISELVMPSEGKGISDNKSMSSPVTATKNTVDDFTVLSENKPTQEVLSSQDSQTITAAGNQNTEAGTNIMVNTSVPQNIEKSPSTSSQTSRSNSMSSISSKSSHSEKKQSDTQVVSTKQTSPPVHSTTVHSTPSYPLPSSQPSLMVNSLDRQMAELQEALRAAGLPPINSVNGGMDVGSVEVEPHTTKSPPPSTDLHEDIEQVLREIATQEVVSLSRKMLNKRQQMVAEEKTLTSQTAKENNSLSSLHEQSKLKADIFVPSVDINDVSSTENLLAGINSLKDIHTHCEEESAVTKSKQVNSVKKKVTRKPSAKRESVFQRLSTPKSTPVPKKPPTSSQRVAPKSVKRSRSAATPKYSKPTFDGLGTYDLKSTTEIFDAKVDKITSDNNTHTLREQKLLQEVENWQNCWKEERDKYEQLRCQLEEKEREFVIREEKLGLEHNKERHQLKQEIFTLSTKVKELECETDNRKRVASGGKLDGVINEEQRLQLEQNIKEQETLLNGYQKENERVYEELTKARNELKTIQMRAFEENQQLAQQLANAKEELQKKDEQLLAAGKGRGALGLERISQLETHLASVSSTCSQLHEHVSELETQNSSIQNELHRSLTVNKDLEQRLVDSVSSSKYTELESSLGSEVKRLKQQLKWYMENQQLIENNVELVQQKDKEITTLKEKLSKKITDKKLTKERAADAARIQQLEKQIKAMETSIRRRYPDSITSLIYASKSSEDDSSSNHTTYLNNRVQRLEQELEAKDKEMSLKIRSLHQKHTNMEVMYEEQIQALKEELEKKKTICATYSENGIKRNSQYSADLSTEVAELRRAYSMLQQERDALLSAQHVSANNAEMTSLILQENASLKNQLKQLELEMTHQKVKYEMKLAESEAHTKQLQMKQEEEIADIHHKHQLMTKQLIEQYTSHQSESSVTQFKSQLATQQVTISRLKQQLHRHKQHDQLLVCSRQKEDQLSKEVKVLKEELLQATKGHTPEMHHFHSLLLKLTTLENRIFQYETRLQSLLTTNQLEMTDQISILQEEWTRKLRGKDTEIEGFRRDLDGIIEALQLLHDQSN
ncbi:centrosomal protein of 162 kDa-like isoform X1 [Dysidea avara]|uniref:centrosomal protein of 162 kDa-like isoform X1 n=1 Tax=Dysidea avara TaxID=196820 RepID=UPI00331E03A1